MHRARARARDVPRRQQPAHAQPALHARGADRVLTDAYPEDEYWRRPAARDRRRDRRGARAAWSCASPPSCPRGCARTACASSRRSRGTLHSARTNAFFLGGGKALMNSYYARRRAARRRRPLRRRGRRRSTSPTAASLGATVDRTGASSIASRAKPSCSRRGGFESNLEWLQRDLGRRPPTTSSCAARRTTRAACCKLMLDARRAAGRRSDAVPLRRDRRARAEVRRRHRDAPRLRSRSASS